MDIFSEEKPYCVIYRELAAVNQFINRADGRVKWTKLCRVYDSDVMGSERTARVDFLGTCLFAPLFENGNYHDT